MKKSSNLLEALKEMPHFSKESVYLLGMNLGLSKASTETYISRFLQRKQLIRLKNGLYVSADFRETHTQDMPHTFYLANILRTPSYVSSWTALQYYDLTTDVIRIITSVTPKLTRTYQTKTGTFAYRSIKRELFCDFLLVQGTCDYFIATPSKALFDLLYFHTHQFRGATMQSIKALIRELRIDWEEMDAGEQEKFHAMITPHLHE